MRHVWVWGLVGLLLGCPTLSEEKGLGAYGFHGHQTGDYDRVKIPLVNRSVNVGGNFTVEFWFKTQPGDNPAGTVNTSATDGSGWVGGHILVDRDIDDNSGSNEHGDWGVAMANGRIAFGVAKGPVGKTIYAASTPDLRDGQWHHVAVTRRTTGQMAIFVDGVLHAQGLGPSGDVSYRNDRVTTMPQSDPYLVLGAEKHDYPGSLAFKGLLSGLRISAAVLYDTNFTPGPQTTSLNPFTTVALYTFRFWDGQTLLDLSGQGNHGQVKVGGSPAGPFSAGNGPY